MIRKIEFVYYDLQSKQCVCEREIIWTGIAQWPSSNPHSMFMGLTRMANHDVKAQAIPQCAENPRSSLESCICMVLLQPHTLNRWLSGLGITTKAQRDMPRDTDSLLRLKGEQNSTCIYNINFIIFITGWGLSYVSYISVNHIKPKKK